MKYETKPVIIEAWEWDETKTTFNKIGCKMMSCTGNTERPEEMKDLRIETLEGTMKADKGDFIIKGLRGEFYPCKPDVFHLKYKPLKNHD